MGSEWNRGECSVGTYRERKPRDHQHGSRQSRSIRCHIFTTTSRELFTHNRITVSAQWVGGQIDRSKSARWNFYKGRACSNSSKIEKDKLQWRARAYKTAFKVQKTYFRAKIMIWISCKWHKVDLTRNRKGIRLWKMQLWFSQKWVPTLSIGSKISTQTMFLGHLSWPTKTSKTMKSYRARLKWKCLRLLRL